MCLLTSIFVMLPLLSSSHGSHEEFSGRKGDVLQGESQRQLFQYDPIEKGVVQYVTDESGHMMEMVTLAVDPPIFEIRNFLTDEECDHVIEVALENGLEPSGVVMELLPSLSNGNEDEIKEIFRQLDADEDMFLNPTECADGLMDIAEGMLSDRDVRIIMSEFKMDSNQDEHLDFEEFKLIWNPDMERSVNAWVKNKLASNDTSFQFSNTRVSDQTWLDQTWYEDQTLLQLHERVIKLTQLPRDIVISSESLQVVRYKPGGHYHAHFDSCELDDSLICSHTQDVSLGDSGATFDIENEAADEDGEYDSSAMKDDVSDDFDIKTTRLCRYATVLFYLNDVEEGGETAFPVADNGTFSYEGLENMPYDVYDLSYHCYDGNLVVKPEKGKAIFWYNHMVNETTGWMGDVYNASLHGGCDVRNGEKWIANNWINVDDSFLKQRQYQEYFKRELEQNKQEASKRKESAVKDESLQTGIRLLDDRETLEENLHGEKDEL